MKPESAPSPLSARRQHWEAIYHAKAEDELSWHQDDPTLSLRLIREVATPRSRIIDVGGGSSRLASRLAEAGCHNVAVLGIANAALERSKKGATVHRDYIRWIAADVTRVNDVGPFDVWHDERSSTFWSTPRTEGGTSISRSARSPPAGT
jgi:2-polyprenyl-3-methyl-5-hydroxy-6-metoxy-1,4-benzoquinol methylase